MHHKRKGPKSTRAGCLMCKPHKHQRNPNSARYKGLKVPRRTKNPDEHYGDY